MYEKTLPDNLTEYVQALIFMGDWFTVQRRTWDGSRMYQRAWATLVEHNAEQSIGEALLGEPQPIEYLPMPGAPEIQPDEDSYYVDALLDVPVSGWPDNIRIQSVHPTQETSLYQRAKRAIAATRYRPRFRNGQAVTATNIPLRYVFKYKQQPGWFHF